MDWNAVPRALHCSAPTPHIPTPSTPHTNTHSNTASLLTKPVVNMPKEASVAVMEALAVRVVVASSPRMMGPAHTAQAQLNSDSFCRAGG